LLLSCNYQILEKDKDTYYLIFSKAQGLVVEYTLISVELWRYEDLFTLENSYFYQPNVVYE